MKIATATREIETSAQVTHQAFRIGDSNKMFALLADKIYSDKPRAVIREIACNALDAHLASGAAVPFKISVPSVIEPMLTIRDFGKALSHGEIMGLYTTFFDSTKGETNDQIGGFGLGSKAPFSYTDAFTVVSIQQGVKRLYAAFRDANGIPQISLAEETRTNDPDGLEVRVPVRREDHATFKTTAADVLRWFPEGSFEPFGFSIEPVEWLLKTQKWGLLKGDGSAGRTYNYKTNSYDTPRGKALMGPVAYELDWSMAKVTGMTSMVVPIFPIGSLDLPPSRETLSYDPTTINTIAQMAADIKSELPKLAFDTAKRMDPWERVQFIDDLIKAGVGRMIGYVYNGGNNSPFKDMTNGFILQGHSRRWQKGWSPTLSRKAEEANDRVYRAASKATIVFDDIPLESANKKRVFARLLEDGGTEYILVENTQKEYKDYDHFLETFGKDKSKLSFIRKLSDMPLPAATTVTAQSKNYTMVIKTSRGCSGFFDYGDKPVSGDVWWPLNGVNIDETDKWFEIAPYLGDQRIIGLTKTAQRSVDLNDFVKADVWVEAQLKLYRADKAIVEVAAEKKARVDFNERLRAGSDDITHAYSALINSRRDWGAALFPTLAPKLQRLSLTPAVSPEILSKGAILAHAAKEGKVKPLPLTGFEDAYDLLVETYNKSDLLKLASLMRQGNKGLLAPEHDAFLQKMV